MMTSSIGEEGYTFNLEWIAEGSGIGEEICGVDKDCIVVPKVEEEEEEEEESDLHQLTDDYVEIQVTEEEVITDQWHSHHNGAEEDPIGFRIEMGHVDEVVVPLPEDQDEYSRLHPYPCDFCSRRFCKKSALTTHMVTTHQVEKSHGCNMCGAQYRRKHELVEHMKVHAYAPEKTMAEEEEEEEYDHLPTVNQAKAKQRARRKKGRQQSVDPLSNERMSKKSRKRYKEPPVPLEPAPPEYLEEEEAEEPTNEDTSPRYPIIDPNRPYVCQSCGIGFAREKALSSHWMVHTGDWAFECDRCHDVFLNARQLDQHLVAKHKQKSKSTFPDDKFGSFHCQQCDIWFQWYSQYKKHRRTHLKSDDVNPVDGLTCPLCQLVYNTVEELELHKEDHEGEIGVHSCDACGEEYEHLYDLHEHVKVCPDSKSLYACNVCDSVFASTKELSRHSLVHMESRSYACPICGRRFYNKGKLRKHVSMHEEQKRGLQCKDCGAELADGRSMLEHKQNVHGLNMSRLFPCVECGKTFGSRSSQQIHVRVHTGEKPYGCRYCWKAFADGGTLRKHERIHTGEKPYVCPVCTKAFNQRVVLREHVRAHHSGPESRLNSNCYECVVCGQMFGTSSELCLHLVHHSDENTAKHRLPSTGQRKFPRKKKFTLPPMDQPTFPPTDVMFDLSETSRDSTDFIKDKKKLTPLNKRTTKFQSEENLESVVKLSESTLDNLNSIVNSAPATNGKRARIVRSGKKGYPKGNNKRFMKGKGKAARLMNNTSYASKYVVSRPSEICGMEGDGTGMQDLLEAAGEEVPHDDDTPPPRSRPRTKNVSYHNMKTEPRFELATFPLQPPESKGRKSRKVSKVKIKKEEQLVDTQFINGIDPSLFDESNHSGEQIETCIVDDIGVELKLEVKTTEPEEYPMLDSVLIKTEQVSCEMCSEVFNNRSDLLKHIQVHI